MRRGTRRSRHDVDGGSRRRAPRSGDARECAAGPEQEEGHVHGPGAHPVALVRGHPRPAAGDRVHLPTALAAEPHEPRVQPGVQRVGAPAVRRVAPGHPLVLPQRPHPAVPVPVPEHGEQDEAVRVPEAHVPGRHRRARKG